MRRHQPPKRRGSQVDPRLAFPSVDEVIRQMESLKASGYSRDARLSASDWATPFVVNSEMYAVDPPALSDAIFLLCSADLPGDFNDPIVNHLYGPADFEAVLEQLRK